MVFLKFSVCDPDECGADALVGVGEQELVADWFDAEVDGGFDQQLIVFADGEVVDGVVALGEVEAVAAGTTDEDVSPAAPIS